MLCKPRWVDIAVVKLCTGKYKCVFRWTLASIPPGGRQLTERNGVMSWA